MMKLISGADFADMQLMSKLVNLIKDLDFYYVLYIYIYIYIYIYMYIYIFILF